MYEKELLVNVVMPQGETIGTMYVKEKNGDQLLTLIDMNVNSKTFLVLLGMVSAYNERYHLELNLKSKKTTT